MALSSSDLTQVRREIERYIRQFPPPGTGLTAPVAATDIGAGSVDNTEFGYLNGVTSAIQTQIDAKQAGDSDLTTIAGLTPTNDDFMQRKAGAWANRTVAQVKTDLNLTGTNSGDQTITLTGAVTGSGTGSFATTLASGVDAAKISAGNVSNTEFDYLDGVTSAIQTQLDAKATKTPRFVTLATDATLTNERVLTAGSHTTITDAGAGSTVTVEWAYDPFRKALFWSDGAGAGDFSTLSSGTGAGVTANSANSDGTHPGVLSISTGTTTTGRSAGQYLEATTIEFGTYAWKSKGVFQVPTASDGTETFSVHVGFFDTFTGTTYTDSACIRYRHSVNAGKFECVTTSNTTETATDSGVTMTAGSWYSYEVRVNAAGTSAAFYINGSLVQTHVANIPTGSARRLGHGHNIVKSAGTTARTLLSDCCLVEGDISR